MTSKLTLSIQQKVVERAKKYAKKQGRSLSNIVEEYLKSVSENPVLQEKNQLDPVVDELWGSVKLPASDTEYKALLEGALVEKYLK